MIEIRRGPDGHYHWPGSLNGLEVDFLIDTGATGTAMSQSMARQLKLEPTASACKATPPAVWSPASWCAPTWPCKAGCASSGWPWSRCQGLGERPLLGMDVLGRLRWQQRDGVLTIDTGAAAMKRGLTALCAVRCLLQVSAAQRRLPRSCIRRR